MQAPLNATGTVTHEGVTSSSNTMTADEMRSSLGIAPAEPEVPDTPDEAPPADAVAEPQPDAAPDAAKPAQPAPEAKKAKKDPQARIDEVVRQREETKRAAAAREAEYQRELRDTREEFRREIEALKRGSAPKPQEPAKQAEPGSDDPEPDVADTSKYPDGQFDRKYLKDQARWEARQEFREQQQAQEQRYRHETQQRQQFERQQKERERIGSFAQRMEQTFAQNPDLRGQLEHAALSRPMWDAVLESAIPDQLLSHLVNTPEELNRILALEPLHAYRAMTRLEVELEKAAAVTGSAPAKPKTSAHAPISPVSGSHTAPASAEPGLDAPYEEWAAYQNKLERESRVRK